MKKLFLLSAVTAGLLTSCVQNDLIAPELSESEKEIKFQTVVAKHSSRAIITGTAYGKDAPAFGTFALQNSLGLMPGTESFMPITEIVHHDDPTDYWGVVSTSSKYYWPPTGSLTFYSYSPFRFGEGTDDNGNMVFPELAPIQPTAGRNGFIFEDYNVAEHQLTDLMVAEIKYGQTANVTHGNPQHTGVPTIFKHKLAMIAGFILLTSEDYDGNYEAGSLINVANNGDMRFKIKKIELLNIPTIGTFTSEGIMSTDATIIEERWDIKADNTGLPDDTDIVKTYTWFDSSKKVTDEEKNGTEFGHRASKQLHIYTAEKQTENIKYETPSVENGYILAIPQTFGTASEASLKITYTIEVYDGTKQEWQLSTHNSNSEQSSETSTDMVRTIPLSSIHSTTINGNVNYGGWEMGKKIVYILEFSTDEIRWAPSVEDWEKEEIKIDY